MSKRPKAVRLRSVLMIRPNGTGYFVPRQFVAHAIRIGWVVAGALTNSDEDPWRGCVVGVLHGG